jgi:2'-5' RNA ligase
MAKNHYLQRVTYSMDQVSLRLFLGIPLPPKVLRLLEAYQATHPAVEGLVWVRPELLHITQYFFGPVPAEMQENLQSLLSLALKNQAAFLLTFQRMTLAPPGKPARMIWARYQKSKAFKELSEQIHQLYAQVQPEIPYRKNPIPHVTLARLRQADNSWAITLPSRPLPDFVVKELLLWESSLGPEGPVYTQLARYRLR